MDVLTNLINYKLFDKNKIKNKNIQISLKNINNNKGKIFIK